MSDPDTFEHLSSLARAWLAVLTVRTIRTITLHPFSQEIQELIDKGLAFRSHLAISITDKGRDVLERVGTYEINKLMSQVGFTSDNKETLMNDNNENITTAPIAKPKSKRGFASMTIEERRMIAAKGGRAAHARGTAHQYTSEEARTAGRKGGTTIAQNRAHMASIGRKGGLAKGKRKKELENSNESL